MSTFRLAQLFVSSFFAEEKRKYPVVIEGNAYSETVKIKLPAGFVVDEMPAPTMLNQPFGSYTAKCEVKDGHLIFTRTLILQAATIPAADYAGVRNFFSRILGAEQAPVVLEKKE